MESDVPETKQCSRCGSRHLMTNLKVKSEGKEIQIELPPATLLQEFVAFQEPPQATICGNCGHVELYVPGYVRMWEEWRKHNT